MEPAFGIYDLSGAFGIFIIAHHDVGRLDADLAFAFVVGVCDLDFDAGHYGADRAVIVEFRARDGDYGRAFGYAVAGADGYAYGIEEFRDLGRERRAAADDLEQPSAESGVDLGEELLPQVYARFEQEVGNLYGFFDLFRLALLFDLFPD